MIGEPPGYVTRHSSLVILKNSPTTPPQSCHPEVPQSIVPRGRDRSDGARWHAVASISIRFQAFLFLLAISERGHPRDDLRGEPGSSISRSQDG